MKQKENVDYRLVKSLKKGDLFAFDKLFLKYSKKLYYFAKGYLGSKEDAEGLGVSTGSFPFSLEQTKRIDPPAGVDPTNTIFSPCQ